MHTYLPTYYISTHITCKQWLITNSDESEYRDHLNKRISWCSENNMESM